MARLPFFHSLAGCLLALGLPCLAAEPRLIALDTVQQSALGLRHAPVAPARDAVISLPGSVVVPPARQVVVATPLPGLLTELTVSVGDKVRAGEVLARLSSPALLELQRSYTAAQAQHALAADALGRDQRLHDEGVIAQARLIATRSRLQEAQALLDERRGQLRLAGVAPDAPAQPGSGMASVAAPVAGVVLETLAARGERLEAAAPLLRLAQLGELWLELQATPERAAQIAPGQRVSWPERELRARVISVGAAVGAGQTVSVRALIEQGAARVRPGELLQARLSLGLPRQAAWRVPLAALARLGGRDLVFAMRPGGVIAVPVTVHGRDDESAMVEAALGAQDRVAVSAIAALKALVSEAAP